MKTKKALLAILSVVAISAATCAFVACDREKEPQPEPHTHTYGEWKSDDANHWKECTEDGEVGEKAKHKADEAKQENVVEAEVLKPGSYDEVTYCSVCNKELTRNKVVVSAKGYAKGQPDTWDGTAATAYEAGDGTQDNPYLIASAEQLCLLANTVNQDDKDCSGVYFSLIKDIDLSNKEWTPIGSGKEFAGIFDGKGYTISNYKITEKHGSSQIGLFGYVTGKLSNIAVKDYTITVSDDIQSIGALAGKAEGTTEYCSATDGNITAAVESGDIYAGGLIGYNRSRVTCCYATGNVSATAVYSLAFAGGLIGINYSTVNYCYATGDVSAKNNSSSAATAAGGLIGSNTDDNSKKGDVNSCFATGSLSATGSGWRNNKGGVVAMQNSYAANLYCSNGSNNDESTMYANNNDLKSKSFLTSSLHFNEEIWKFSTLDYPTLKVFD